MHPVKANFNRESKMTKTNAPEIYVTQILPKNYGIMGQLYENNREVT